MTVAKHIHTQDRLCRVDKEKYIGKVSTRAENGYDSCFYTTSGDVLSITSINKDGSLNGNLFRNEHLESIYHQPCSSKDLFITKVTNQTPVAAVENLPRSSLHRKAVILPVPNKEGEKVLVGVLHTMK